jgi:hypothetical protein
LCGAVLSAGAEPPSGSPILDQLRRCLTAPRTISSAAGLVVVRPSGMKSCLVHVVSAGNRSYEFGPCCGAGSPRALLVQGELGIFAQVFPFHLGARGPGADKLALERARTVIIISRPWAGRPTRRLGSEAGFPVRDRRKPVQ